MANTQPSPEGNYSFFVHSDPTMSSNSPLRIECSQLPKQKRRRTSPRDHAILEAAYQRNSKPDKHERADIVSQVELGEKEVQIWFQNRRQNDRRKSKPLQPHELLAHFRNGLPAEATDSTPSDIENRPTAHPIANSVTALDVPRPSSRSSSIHELLNPSSSTGMSAACDGRPQKAASELLPTPPSSFESKQRPADVSIATHSGQTSSQPPHALTHSRKRSHEVMLDDPVKCTNVNPLPDSAVLSQPKSLSRSSSFVRLAMTVDGAVKVRTNNDPTPSPPKQRTLPPIDPSRKRESFGRSQSAVENGFDFRDANPPVRKIGGAGFGRSRDARTWEFYCDRDSGDALSTQAEAERSGSAIGAINLLRSRSQRSKVQALSPNPVKQNFNLSRTEHHRTKPKLSRAMSSMGRLQSIDGAKEVDEKVSKRPKHDVSPSGDSDKENWAPGTRTSHHHMRRVHPGVPRGSILQENDFPSARDPTSSIVSSAQENAQGATKEKAKGDDLDCIQGLLSLSQGAWQ